MPTVNFYHLTRSTPEAALFKLLARAFEGGHRAVVRFAHDEDVSAFDTALWAKDPTSFLPHGTPASKYVQEEKILLTSSEENLNKAEFAFIFPDCSTESIDFYERVFLLFEGSSETQIKEARERWKSMKEKGFDLIYWTQDENGKWAKKVN